MKIRSSFCSLALCATVFVACFASTGCHRGFYRRQADNDANMLIREKLTDARWNQIDPSIDPPGDSRMYDPFSADNPPMPPDDPASDQFMQCVDNKPGYRYWHVNGDTRYVDNPEWRAYLPLNERGVLVLDLDTAVQLSLIHSTELQRQRENLYLSALEVSLERFGFDAQAFYGFSSFFRTQGRSNPGGSASTIELTQGPSRTRLQKLGINGASFVVGIANTVIWNFAGNNTQSANTIIDFTLLQPLLRGAGRQIVMESLTQAERDLLADIRQLERFRRGFNLFVVAGRNAGGGPRTNFLNEPTRANFTASGFIGLLQTRQEIRIAEFNVRSLENVLAQFREFFEEQRINLLQVRSVESSLYSAQDSLLRQRVRYENDLDQFKRDLGLPPDLPVEIDDPFLVQFELVDDTLLERQLEVNLLRDEVGLALDQISPNRDDEGLAEDQELEWTDELAESLRALLPVLEKLDPYFELLEGQDSELVEKDFAKLESVTSRRVEELKSLRELILESETRYEIEPSILQPESITSVGQLRSELQELRAKISQIKGLVEVVAANISRILEDGPTLTSEVLKKRLEDEIVYDAPEVVTKLADAVIELTLIQARARTNSISLPEVDIDAKTATTIACQFRRDLMNARAALVDQWRQIELSADDLESTLDVVFDGSVGSTSDNPFEINWNTNQFGMGLRFDAPITRQAERNQYRQTLINYQRARRDFYRFEDSISQNLRETVRVIDQSKVVFELNRRSIGVAVEQVELARYDLIEPVRPGQGGVQGQTLGPTAAQDLVRALNELQSAQNRFLEVWVAHEVSRRGLDFDMGTMQLSPEGFWLDPGTINAMYAYRAAEAFGIPPESICLPPDVSFLTDPDPQNNDEVIRPPTEAPIDNSQ